MGAIITLSVIWWIGQSLLCGWLAEEKGRSVGAWIVLGLLFGIFALIALAGSPIIDEYEEEHVENPVRFTDPR